MKNILSGRVQAMTVSATIAMTKKAREYRAQGKDVISLSIGEPDFKTPKHIQEAAKRIIDKGEHFGYPPVAGYTELREAIAKKLQRDNDIQARVENIVVSTGAKQSIANVILALVNPGDEVIVFTPYWVSYIEQIKLAGGIPKYIEGKPECGYKVSGDELAASLTEKTKLVIYSSPCNPTGAVWSKDELASIAKVIEKNNHLYVIADEIYEYINFTGKHVSLASFESISAQVITVNGFSKGFAMTGWRIGYICAPSFIAKACEKIQGQFTSGTCSIAQQAALAAIEGSLEATHKMSAAYLERRDLIFPLLEKIAGFKLKKPEGAFYFFPDVSYYFGKSYKGNRITNADDLAMYLLDEAYVSVVTGSAFGAPNGIRISYAASKDVLIEAMKRIEKALKKLS